jgi:hypothetical protein
MRHVDETFIDQDISVDGTAFERCAFVNCRLLYNGGELPDIRNCNISPPTVWRFGGSAYATLALVQGIANATKGGALAYERLMEVIGRAPENERDEISADQSISMTFDFLELHTQHAVAVAKIAAIFSTIEFELCQLFSWMLQCYPIHAAAAYYQLQNSKARIDMIRGLIPHLHDADERSVVSDIITLASECARIRNLYCHALWQRKDDKIYLTENLDSRYPHGTRRLVSLRDILLDTETVQGNLSRIESMFVTLTEKRALVLAPEALKPSYAPKFHGRRAHRAQPDAPIPPTKTAEPSHQPPPSEE